MSLALISPVPAAAATGSTSSQNGSCPVVFSGEQGALGIEAYPPRYQQPAQDNGDGTFTLAYGLVLGRYLGSSSTADAAHTCVFVDRNGNGAYDQDEPLFGLLVAPATFGAATSSTLRLAVRVVVAAAAGDRICARAQVDSSYGGQHTDKSQYFCEVLPAAPVLLPAGALATLPLIAALGLPLLARRRRAAPNRERSR